MLLVLFTSGAAGVMVTRTGTPSQSEADAREAAERAAVSTRFREIVDLRERALRKRDTRILKRIYTPDSPQLRRDRSEIQRLRDKDERWKGLSLPVSILQVRPDSSRRWTVVALLGRSDARLETEAGKLIRQVEGAREVYWCTLVKDPGKGWLLYRLAPP